MYSEPVWKPKAEADLVAYTQYLEQNWPAATLHKFAAQLQIALQKLEASPTTFRLATKKRPLRRCRVDRYISLYFVIRNKRAEILYFQHAARNPSRLGL